MEAALAAVPDFGGPERPQVAVFLGLVTAASRDPELRAALSGPVVERPRRAVAEMLDRAAARGEIPPGRDVSLVPDVVIAMSSLRLLLGEAVDRDFLRRVFEDVVYPLVSAPVPGPRPRRPGRAGGEHPGRWICAVSSSYQRA